MAAVEFNPVGPLNTPRLLHTATLLGNGKVLIAGSEGAQTSNRAELYDPLTRSFSATGDMKNRREGAAAIALSPTSTAKVLIVGGYDNTTGDLASAELYDPTTGVFWPTGSLSMPRSKPLATLLMDGQVLIAGGYTSKAERYDPVSGTFRSVGFMNVLRLGATNTLLPNGKVLIVGGDAGVFPPRFLASAEIYNPADNTFSSTGSLGTARRSATATLLPNGKVLITGGYDNTGNLASAELYDPISGQFQYAGDMLEARSEATANLLPNGQVLVVGGHGNVSDLYTAEVYDPFTESFSPGPSLITARQHATATLAIPTSGSWQVLIVGGLGAPSSAEIYTETADWNPKPQASF